MSINSPDLTTIPKISIRSLVGWIVSVALLWLTLEKSGLQVSEIKLIGQNQWTYFLAAIGLFVASLWFYAWRARLIWKVNNHIHHVDTYASLILGNFYNGILPGNLGEAVRAWHFSRKNRQSLSRSLAGIITEKWLDAQVFAVLVILLFVIKPFIKHFVAIVLINMAVGVLAAVVVHALMKRNKKTERFFWSILMMFSKPGRFLFKTYLHTNGHLERMKKNNTVWGFVILFLFIFALNMGQFYCLMKAANISFPVAGLYGAFLISLSMMIIAFIPSAPGSIGVLHYGVYSALILIAELYNLTPTRNDLQQYALFGVYTHLSFFIPEVILGIYYLAKEKEYLFKSLKEFKSPLNRKIYPPNNGKENT